MRAILKSWICLFFSWCFINMVKEFKTLMSKLWRNIFLYHFVVFLVESLKDIIISDLSMAPILTFYSNTALGFCTTDLGFVISIISWWCAVESMVTGRLSHHFTAIMLSRLRTSTSSFLNFFGKQGDFFVCDCFLLFLILRFSFQLASRTAPGLNTNCRRTKYCFYLKMAAIMILQLN